MITKLEKIANEQRAEHLARNEYKYTNSYGSTHPNALSTGDEKGKGQVGDSGDVGGLTDINTRIDNTGRNFYKSTHRYPDFEF